MVNPDHLPALKVVYDLGCPICFKEVYYPHRLEDSLLEDAGLTEKYMHGCAVSALFLCVLTLIQKIKKNIL